MDEGSAEPLPGRKDTQKKKKMAAETGEAGGTHSPPGALSPLVCLARAGAVPGTACGARDETWFATDAFGGNRVSVSESCK
jgi:hypothetical protein